MRESAVKAQRGEKTMRGSLVVLAIIGMTGPASASDKTEVVAVVNQFLDGFNKGDTKAALATCAPQTAIIDEFSPYVWQGSTACSDWANDFDADAKKNGITDAIVTLGKPRHVDIVGDRAYLVMPANFKFKVKGKPTAETGSTFTVTLQKLAAGWRITGWAWAKH
jgi:ketosteroid isomerase-like protein